MKKALAVNSNGSNNTSEGNNKNINISLIFFVFVFGNFFFVHHIKLKSYFFSHNKIMYEYEEN